MFMLMLNVFDQCPIGIIALGDLSSQFIVFPCYIVKPSVYSGHSCLLDNSVLNCNKVL